MQFLLDKTQVRVWSTPHTGPGIGQRVQDEEIQESETAAPKNKRKRGKKIRKHNRKQAKQAQGKEETAIPIVQEEEVGAASLVDGSVSKNDKPRKQTKSAKNNALSCKISEPKPARKRQRNTKKKDVVEGHVLGRQNAICEHGRRKSQCKVCGGKSITSTSS